MTEARRRLVVFATHPIQYQAPWFRALAADSRLDLLVLFMWQPQARDQGKGFGVEFSWDVPLLDGYAWRVIQGCCRAEAHGFLSLRVPRARAVLKELDADAVLITGWHSWSLLQILLAANALKIPVIMRGESNGMRPRGWRSKLLHRWILARCNAFLSIGKANRQFYSAYGVKPTQLFDAPYFVDNQRFSESADALRHERSALRQHWGVLPDAVCFCFVGKLEPKKRVMDLLRALLAAVANRAGPLHVLIVGSGEQEAQAREFVMLHALPVTFAGFLNQSRIATAYVASDCLVLPSDHGETWGLVVNEAMACGLPALVSDQVGCAADLVTDGVTGHVFPMGNVAALSSLLVRLSECPDALSAQGQRARDRVLSHYTIARAATATADAVQAVTHA